MVSFTYILPRCSHISLFRLLLYVHSFSSWPTGMLVFTFSHILFRQIKQTFTCNLPCYVDHYLTPHTLDGPDEAYVTIQQHMSYFCLEQYWHSFASLSLRFNSPIILDHTIVWNNDRLNTSP